MNIPLPFRPRPIDIPEKADFAETLYYFLWAVMGAVTLLWALLSVFIQSETRIWLTFYVPTIVASVVALLLNMHGRQRSAIIFLLFSGWAIFTFIAVLYWHVILPDTNRYILIVVSAGLLLGRRAGFLAASICALTEIILALLIRNGTIPSAMPQLPLETLLPHLLFLYLGAFIPALAIKRVRVALQLAKEELEERRRADEIAAENETRFMTIVDSSPDPIMIHKAGTLAYVNPASLGFFRAQSPDQLIGRSITEIVQPESRALLSTTAGDSKGPKAPSQIREGKMIRLDGSIAEVETSSMPVSFEGEPGIQTIVRDVTELRELQERMHLQIAALNSAANGILITDRDGTILWVNAAFESLTGYSYSETVGRNPRDLVKSGKQSAEFYRELWETILSGKVWHGELVNRRKDNSLYDEYMAITPVLDNHGVITNFVAVKQDITSRKLLEEQLIQSQKLEGIGQLAGGVAHDFNNLLNVVTGYAELLRRKTSDGDPANKPLDAIMSAARRGADLTRQLLAFARRDTGSPRVVNINYAIESIANMLRRVLGEYIKLILVPSKNLWNVLIDPAQFDQILVNLASNSKDAIKDAGTITITTSNFSADGEFVARRSGLRPGDYVKVTFEDDGRGMDAETLNRVFEPFFSTKPKAHGAGLGLSTIYGIMKQSKGIVEITSEPGKGTTVTLYIPRAAGESVRSDTQSGDDSLRGSETILVVEDQTDLLNLVKATLEGYGYHVMASIDPVDAELIADSYLTEIHLLLTDVVMPQMGGVELSRRLIAKRPKMKTLYMSGYNSESFTDYAVPGKGDELIQKPFQLQELARKVREILTSHKQQY